MLTGVHGSIQWRIYTAAAVTGYTVACSKDGHWSLVAQLVLADAFKMAQTPLTFVAKHKGGAWRWPILSHEVHADTQHLTARLGPPEEAPRA